MKYQVEIITKTPKIIVESHHPLLAITDLFHDKKLWNPETRKTKIVKKQQYSIRYKVKNLDNGKIFTGSLEDFKYRRDERTQNNEGRSK